MKKELYFYAKPNLPNENECPFNWLHILCVSLFSSLTLFLGNITFGIIILAVYPSLSLLTYIDKDMISRYLKLSLLAVVCVYVAGMYIAKHLFPEAQIALHSLFGGLIFFACHEVSVITKIKKRASAAFAVGCCHGLQLDSAV